VTVAADSSARYYSSSCAPDLAQPSSLLRRILCRGNIIAQEPVRHCLRDEAKDARPDARPQRLKTGGGTRRTSWDRSPIQWILANGKTPPALLPSENLNRYVEGLNDARTTNGKRRVSARLGGVGEKGDFFSILLDADPLERGVLMVTVSRRVLLPFLALILVPPVFSVLAPNPVQAGETPSLLLATVAPTEHLSLPVTWLDDLEQRLTTYFAKKYPAYDFSPYTQELDRIRGAISLGDRWGARREMGVFLTMLASRAYGLGDDAAEELSVLSQRIMPDEEFGIVYPGSSREP